MTDASNNHILIFTTCLNWRHSVNPMSQMKKLQHREYKSSFQCGTARGVPERNSSLPKRICHVHDFRLLWLHFPFWKCCYLFWNWGEERGWGCTCRWGPATLWHSYPLTLIKLSTLVLDLKVLQDRSSPRTSFSLSIVWSDNSSCLLRWLRGLNRFIHLT